MSSTQTKIKTLKDIQNADSDIDVVMTKKEFLIAKNTNEETIRQLENRLKEQIAIVKASEQKIKGALTGFNNAKDKAEKERQRAEKAESEIKLLQEQLNVLKNNKNIKIDIPQQVYKINDEKLKEGADIIYERHHKKDVEAFLKQFEL